jgi:hypothetical protein
VTTAAPTELATRFERDGYLAVADFFEHDLMDELDSVIRRHFGDAPEFLHSEDFLERSQTDVIPWFPQREGVTAFDSIDGDGRLDGLTTALLGAGWTSQYCMVMFSKPGTNGQAWHQDCAPDDPRRFNLNRLVYTSDITDAIGGQLVVVPGSHRRGLLPAGDPLGGLDDQLVIRPPKGSLVILHGHTWHRVLPITGGGRCSTNFRAAPLGTPDDITDVAVYRNMRYRFSTAEVVEQRSVGHAGSASGT